MIQVVGRRLIIPDCDRLIGFEDDNDSRTVVIGVLNSTLCDVFGDASGISASLLVRYKDSVSDEGVVHPLIPGENTDKHTVWVWGIESGSVKKSGVVEIQLYLTKQQADTENTVWHSDIDLMYIGDSIKLGNFAEGGEQMTAFEALLARMGVVLGDMNSAKEDAVNAKNTAVQAKEFTESAASAVASDKAVIEELKKETAASEHNAKIYAEDAASNSQTAVDAATSAAESAKTADNAVKAHANLKNNPHGVTAELVGTYTKAEVDAKVNAVQSFTSDVNMSVVIHKQDVNPHNVTAEQVGAYTKDETNSLLSTKAKLGHEHDEAAGAVTENILISDDLANIIVADDVYGTVEHSESDGIIILNANEYATNFTINTIGYVVLKASCTDGNSHITINGESLQWEYSSDTNTYSLSYEGEVTEPIYCNVIFECLTLTKLTCTSEPISGFMNGADKAKLNGIEPEANKTIVDTELLAYSRNPIANSVVTAKLGDIDTALDGIIAIQETLSEVKQHEYS